MWKWKYNGRSETVSDEMAAKMRRDIAFKRYEWEQVASPAKKQAKAVEPPVTNDPDADGNQAE